VWGNSGGEGSRGSDVQHGRKDNHFLNNNGSKKKRAGNSESRLEVNGNNSKNFSGWYGQAVKSLGEGSPAIEIRIKRTNRERGVPLGKAK